jgi:hypothetical protein
MPGASEKYPQAGNIGRTRLNIAVLGYAAGQALRPGGQAGAAAVGARSALRRLDFRCQRRHTQRVHRRPEEPDTEAVGYPSRRIPGTRQAKQLTI